MGVMTHEWIHTFGMREAPMDTYDTSTGAIGGLGAFDIMASPAGFSNNIAEPGSLSPFSKDNVGWLEYIDITADGTYMIRPSNKFPDIYRIKERFPEGEYLVIENRQPSSFDRRLYGGQGGLLIYYTDMNVVRFGTKDFPGQQGWPGNGNHYKFALLPTDGQYDLEQGNNIGDEGDLWVPGMTLGPKEGNNSPNTDTYRNGSTGFYITDIKALGNGNMSFQVLGFSPVTEPIPAAPVEQPVQKPVEQPVEASVEQPVATNDSPQATPVIELVPTTRSNVVASSNAEAIAVGALRLLLTALA